MSHRNLLPISRVGMARLAYKPFIELWKIERSTKSILDAAKAFFHLFQMTDDEPEQDAQ